MPSPNKYVRCCHTNKLTVLLMVHYCLYTIDILRKFTIIQNTKTQKESVFLKCTGIYDILSHISDVNIDNIFISLICIIERKETNRI